MSLRDFFSLRTLAVMIAGGGAVMLGAAFAHWNGVQQDVAAWAWLATVAMFRASWLLFTQHAGTTEEGP